MTENCVVLNTCGTESTMFAINMTVASPKVRLSRDRKVFRTLDFVCVFKPMLIAFLIFYTTVNPFCARSRKVANGWEDNGFPSEWFDDRISWQSVAISNVGWRMGWDLTTSLAVLGCYGSTLRPIEIFPGAKVLVDNVVVVCKHILSTEVSILGYDIIKAHNFHEKIVETKAPYDSHE